MAKKSKAPMINGAEMLKLRKKLGLNQAQFWSNVGVTQSGGSRYESGREIPKPTKRLIYLVMIACVSMTTEQTVALKAI